MPWRSAEGRRQAMLLNVAPRPQPCRERQALVEPPSAGFGEEAGYTAADADERVQGRRGQLPDLQVPTVKFFEEDLHGGDARSDSRLRGALGPRLADEALEHRHGGNDFALDALIDHREEERPDISSGAEEIAAVTHAAVDLDEIPVLQLSEAGADIGACDGEGVGDIFRG